VFRSIRDFVDCQRYAAQGNPQAIERMTQHFDSISEYQLALAEQHFDEYALGDDTTTTGAGIVPDYLATEVIGLIDNFRPGVNLFPRDPAGDHGMAVVYPEVKTKPDVDTQATQNTEVTSQAMDIDPKSVSLVTYAGASQIAMQLIERSQPSFLNRVLAELAGVYAQRTDAAFVAALVSGAGNTAIVADLGADAAATYAAFAVAAGDVAAGIKRPANAAIVAVDRFVELIGLVDSEGRPLVTPAESGPNNAQGVGGLSSFRFDYAGLSQGIVVDPHAADGTCAVVSTEAAASVETASQQVRAVQAGLLAVDVGIWGMFAPVVKYADGISTITPS
jgi:HK97 family phage major capsid protein